jgi:hypothetical protein
MPRLAMEIKPGILAHIVLRTDGEASAEACDEPLILAALVDIHPDSAKSTGFSSLSAPGQSNPYLAL